MSLVDRCATMDPTTKSGPRRANDRPHGTGTEVQVQSDPTDFSTEYVIWTANDGGPCEGPFYGQAAATQRLNELIAEDAENADDLSVMLAADAVEDCDGDCIGCDTTCVGCAEARGL